MEIINDHIKWNEEDKTITIRKRLCKSDIQCILFRNPKRFIIDILNKESLTVIKNIRKKINIPYLLINNIARDCDNLINGLPDGINTLILEYRCWNKKISNLPNSLKTLSMFCYTNEDCQNLPHGIENLNIGIGFNTTIDLSNLPSSIKNLTLQNYEFKIDINCIPKSINILTLINCYDSCIPIENNIEQIHKLSIKNNNSLPILQILKKFNNCIDLSLNLLDFDDELLNSISSTIKKITFVLENINYCESKIYYKNIIFEYAKSNPEKEIIILD